MSWLQEARGALLKREAAEAAARTEEQRRADKLKHDAELASQEIARKQKEALILLRSSGVRRLLEDVKQEVWRGGRVEEFVASDKYWEKKRWHDCDVAIGLVHRYIEVGSTLGRDGSAVKNEFETQEVLSVGIKFGDAALEYHLGGCIKGEYLPTSKPGPLDDVRDFFRRDSIDNPQSN